MAMEMRNSYNTYTNLASAIIQSLNYIVRRGLLRKGEDLYRYKKTNF